MTPVKFHLDESVDPAVSRGLLLRGVDTTTSIEAALLGASDEEQLAFALAQSRAIVTHDSDFLRLDSFGHEHAGVAYCRPRSKTIGQLVLALALLARTSTAVEIRGKVVFL